TIAGSEAQRKKWLRGVADGSLIAAIAITEPEAGSDMLSIETRAERTRGGYVLSGTKTLISNAGIADFYVVYARTAEGSARDRGALSAFLVDRKAPGLSLARKLELIAPHPIGELKFDKVQVPADQRIGKEGEGFDLAIRTLEVFRPSVGAAAVGMASRALKESLDHVGRRRQFGQLLSTFQGIKFKLADMATKLRASELMVFSAASSRARGGHGPEASMAKLFATEAAQEIIDDAVQIHGGMGVVRGSAVERLYRSIRALRIYEGTSEIQKIVIARSLTGEP
ncbi:MAG TPA: acyl-CoA dehydrogenase, partial [Planctomycetota bacterium]|nr:acyl-CoA dehydrogenase [Planctomycetota bacterium]